MFWWLNFAGSKKNKKQQQILTGQYGASLALLLHVSVFLSRQSKRRLKHEPVDVVMSLKVSPFVTLFFLVKVGHHVCHLDVGELGIQVFRIYLFVKNITLLSSRKQLGIFSVKLCTSVPTDSEFIHFNGQIL